MKKKGDKKYTNKSMYLLYLFSNVNESKQILIVIHL